MKRKHTVLKGFAVVSTALLLTLSGVGNFSPIESSTNGTQKVASNVKVDTSTNGFAQTISSLFAGNGWTVEAESDIASGTWGTCPWTIDANGVLTIGAGTGSDTGRLLADGSLVYEDNNSPSWLRYKDKITKVVATEKIMLPSISYGLFYWCTNLKSVDISGFDSSNCIDLSSMFDTCTSLTSLDVSKLDTSNVKYMSGMFEYCTSLTSLDVTNFDTSKVTSMWKMFKKCTSLKSLDVTKFNTSNVEDTHEMFSGCSGLSSLDVTNFDTSKVVAMSYMFDGCIGLTSMDVSKWNTSNAKQLGSMFRNCDSLKDLDLSTFDTSSAISIMGICESCDNLESLNLDFKNHPTDPTGAYLDSFKDDTKLKKLTLSADISGSNFYNGGPIELSGLTSPSPVGTTAGTYSGKWTRKSPYNHADAISTEDLVALKGSKLGDTWVWEINGEQSFDVTINKVDESNNALKDADLKVSDSDKNTVEEWTSTEEAKVISLPEGSYTLSEVTAPTGYDKADDIAFTVSDDGTVTVANKTVDSVTMVDTKTAPVTTTFTLDSNNGSGETKTITLANGDKLPECPFTYDGYEFVGWEAYGMDDKSGTADEIAAGKAPGNDTVTDYAAYQETTKVTTFYAKWKKVETPTPTPTTTPTATPTTTAKPTSTPTATSKTTYKSPDTSDDSSMWIWAFAMIIAAASIGGVVVLRGKHGN